MAEQDRERWKKVVADFESCDLTQREFAKRARRVVLEPALLDLPAAEGVAPARHRGGQVVVSSPTQGTVSEGSRLLPVRVVASASKTRTRAMVMSAGDELLELALPSGEFPVLCKGIVPDVASVSGYGHINVPIQCAGVAVSPGDIIVIDGNDVVVVAKDEAAEILKNTQQLLQTENILQDKIRAGATIGQLVGVDDVSKNVFAYQTRAVERSRQLRLDVNTSVAGRLPEVDF